MANQWLNKYLRMKPEVTNIFEDLEHYQKFCVDYGYVFDEKHLYNGSVPAYSEYLKFVRGREPWDQWRSPRRERKEFAPRNNNNFRYNNQN
jgi:hypothetical protein